MKRRHQRTALALLAAVTSAATALPGTPAAAVAPASPAPARSVTGGTPLNTRSAPSAGSTRTGTVAHGATVSHRLPDRRPVHPRHGRATPATGTAWPTTASSPTRTSTAGEYRDPRLHADDAGARRLRRLDAARGGRAGQRLPYRAAPGPRRRRPRRDAQHPDPRGRRRHASSGSSATSPRGSCDVDGSRKIGGCGWYVEVQHPGNIVTRYCHMVRRPSVTVGQTVARGTILGYVGTSGYSSGPHLHFEVHIGARPPAPTPSARSPS